MRAELLTATSGACSSLPFRISVTFCIPDYIVIHHSLCAVFPSQGFVLALAERKRPGAAPLVDVAQPHVEKQRRKAEGRLWGGEGGKDAAANSGIG